ncbi:MAG: NADPH:quinone reductase [Actinomycetia bacterium]|nr:NADPH:quinone reductase [Actinomycetes bacterium]
MGDRVYGGALGRAVADFVVVKTPTEASESFFHTPEGISDEVANTIRDAVTLQAGRHVHGKIVVTL